MNFKKAQTTVVVSLIVVLATAAITFMFLNTGISSSKDFLNKGSICLATLKLQNTTGKSTSVAGLNVDINLVTQKCSTIYDTIELKRENIAGKVNETNKQDALAKQIATRMANVWWMIGAGTIQELWKDKSLFNVWLINNPNEVKNKDPELKCITLMEFDIEKTAYTPDTIDTGYLADYLINEDFIFSDKGEKVAMSYYDYLTSYGGLDTGMVLSLPTVFKPGNTYSISIIAPPGNVNAATTMFKGIGQCLVSFGIMYGTTRIPMVKLPGKELVSVGEEMYGAASAIKFVGTKKGVAAFAGLNAVALKLASSCGENIAKAVMADELKQIAQDQLTQWQNQGQIVTPIYAELDENTIYKPNSFILISHSSFADAFGCQKIIVGNKYGGNE
jgi:hypothetical protein